MISLFNLTDQRVYETIYGALIEVPPYGSVQTSQRNAEEMVRLFPDKLSLQPHAQFSNEDFDAVEKLNKSDLKRLCFEFMKGISPKPSEMVAKESVESESSNVQSS